MWSLSRTDILFFRGTKFWLGLILRNSYLKSTKLHWLNKGVFNYMYSFVLNGFQLHLCWEIYHTFHMKSALEKFRKASVLDILYRTTNRVSASAYAWFYSKKWSSIFVMSNCVHLKVKSIRHFLKLFIRCKVVFNPPQQVI